MAARTERRPLVWLMLATLVLTLGVVTASSPAAASGDPCGTGGQPRRLRELQARHPRTEWDVADGGDTSIQGFATDISVNVGSTSTSRSRPPRTAYHVDIYRIGYYQGNGARLIAQRHGHRLAAAEPARLPHRLDHPASSTAATGACRRRGRCRRPPSRASTWPSSCATTPAATTRSCSWSATTPATPTSIFQTSDTTWQAYNDWGGNSLYTGHRPAGGPTRSATTGRSHPGRHP